MGIKTRDVLRTSGAAKFLALLVCILISAVVTITAAPPPLGDPNEVWVTTSSGDTIVVGEQIELEFYFANENFLEGMTLHMGIDSPDSASWEWIKPIGGYGNDPTREYVTIVPASRWDGSFQFFTVDLFSIPSLGGPDMDSLAIYTVAFSLVMDAGPLEHMWSLHLRPTHTGAICLDSIYIPPLGVSPWYFEGSGTPSWAGPICFTVTESVEGDINCDGQASIQDALHLINWIFRGGPPPCR